MRGSNGVQVCEERSVCTGGDGIGGEAAGGRRATVHYAARAWHGWRDSAGSLPRDARARGTWSK